jgi:hypothetical protein
MCWKKGVSVFLQNCTAQYIYSKSTNLHFQPENPSEFAVDQLLDWFGSNIFVKDNLPYTNVATLLSACH